MKLAILGEYDAGFEPHLQTNAAIAHSAAATGIEVDYEWLSTADDRIAKLIGFDAVWIAPGSPYKNLARTLESIRHARERNLPTLGTCGGFQHMVIEYARNCVGLSDAQHAEYDPYASRLIVSRLACSLVGRELRVALQLGSRTATAYGTAHVVERYYCNFGVHPDFVAPISAAGFSVVGVDEAGECRVMECSQHRFYIGTLFVPQATSRPDRPHPLISAFLRAAAE